MNFEEEIDAEIQSWSGTELITVAEDSIRAIFHDCTLNNLADQFADEMRTSWGDSYDKQRDIIIYGLKAANTPPNIGQTLTLTISELRILLSWKNLAILDNAQFIEGSTSYQELAELFISKARDKHHSDPANGSGSESGVETWHARK